MFAAGFVQAYEDDFIAVDDASMQRIDVGGDRVYVFTNATLGTLNVELKKMLQLKRFLVVGGGGAGGWTLGGGGGAGGVLDGSPDEMLTVGGTLTLGVGAGGDPLAYSRVSGSWLQGGDGGSSTLAYGSRTFTAYGGAGGRAWSAPNPVAGTFGSGGGCAANSRAVKPAGMVLQGYVLNPVSGQGYTGGFAGGKSINVAAGGSYDHAGGGGGGAGGAGGDSGLKVDNVFYAGRGGLGITNDITGVEVEYAAGGGGGAGNGVRGQGLAGGVSAGNGGLANGAGGPTPGTSAPDGFGGGGGGGGYSGAQPGGFGGTGTVILRVTDQIAVQYPLEVAVSGTGGVTVNGEAPAGGEQFPGGATVTVAATPGEGFRFGYWSGDVGAISVGARTSPSVTVLMTAATSLRANFIPAGADYVDEVDGRLRLLVDVAAETYLDAWCAARTPAIVDMTAFDAVVKRGAGTLWVTNGLFALFKGDVNIEAGRVTTTLTDALGPSAFGKVVVSSNATLNVKSLVSTVVPFGSKPVHYAGDGCDGKGALYDEQPDHNLASGLPYKQYLTGNAKIGEKMRSVNYGISSIYLEGHTLSFYLAQDYGTWNPHIYDTTGSGHLVMVGTVLLSGTQNFHFGTPANTLTIKSGCFLRTHNNTVSAPWTLVMEQGSWFQPTQPSVWTGPVVLNDHHRITRQSGFSPYRQTFLGPISGPGGIGTSSNADITEIVLSNTTNTFKGGIYLKKNVLTLGGNGSLPADGAALTNVNGSVQFNDAQSYHDLPEAYFSGTGTVVCTVGGGARTPGAWRNRMVKADAGELTYNVLVGSPKLEVRGGTVRFPVTDAAELPVFTNVQVRTGAAVAFGDGFTGAWGVTNLVSGGGTIGGDVAAEGFIVDAAAIVEGPLEVAGSCTFVPGSQVRLAEAANALTAKEYFLLEADSIIAQAHVTDTKNWYVEVVDAEGGRKRLRLFKSVGTMMYVR